MKKTISLLLALALCLSLCACGGGENNTPNAPETTDATVQDTTARKNELLQTAEPFVYRDYYEDVWGNIVKAENTYKGKVFLMNAHVEEITESYVVINGIVVYLSTEEIMQMNTYDYAEVVGVIDEVGDIGSSVMYEAYLITTIYKETGSVTEISTLDGVSFPYYTIKTDEGREIAVNFGEEKNVDLGDVIVVEGTKSYNNISSWPLSEIVMEGAKLIETE